MVAAGELDAVVTLVLDRRQRGLSQGSGTVEAMPVRHWRLWVIGAVWPLAVLAGMVVAFVPKDVVATPHCRAWPRRRRASIAAVDPGR